MAPFIVNLARWTNPNFFSLAKKENAIQVLTISISHYCDFSLWALKLGKKNFVEHGYAPGQHVLPVLSLRVGGEKKFLSNSSRVTGVEEQKRKESLEVSSMDEQTKKKLEKRDASARSTAVPVAVLPNGDVLRDSWEIARYPFINDPSSPVLSGLDEKTMKLLDDDLAPLARQYAYSHILKAKNVNVFNGLCTEGRSWLWRLCWTLFVGNYVIGLMTKIFKPNDAVAVKECRDKFARVVDQVSAMVENRKTPFLAGEQIGLVDIAIASFIGPLVCAPEYCEGRYAHWFDLMRNQDELVRADVEHWRSTPAGKYALELYRNHR